MIRGSGPVWLYRGRDFLFFDGDRPLRNLCRRPVTTPRFLAAQTGRQILEASGGTALEAAVATAASLAVVYPHMNAVGGDSWLIKKKDCAPVGVLACGQAAGRATVDLYKSRGLEAIPPRGALAAVTVPGTIRGWQVLLSLPEHPRRLSLKDILNPAVGFAANGFPVSASQERTTRAAFESLRSCPGFAEVSLNSEGLPWTKGQTLRQSALARTLQRLSESGLADFYEGDVAAQICRELADAGSLLTPEDFAACRARIVKPLHLRAFGQDFLQSSGAYARRIFACDFGADGAFRGQARRYGGFCARGRRSDETCFCLAQQTRG